MKKIYFITCLFGALLAVQTVLAAPLTGALEKLNQSVVGTGVEQTTLTSSISDVIRAILSLVGTIFFALTIYAGITWMTSQGVEEKTTKAKDILSAAVIGLVITLAAYAITYFVASKFG